MINFLTGYAQQLHDLRPSIISLSSRTLLKLADCLKMPKVSGPSTHSLTIISWIEWKSNYFKVNQTGPNYCMSMQGSSHLQNLWKLVVDNDFIQRDAKHPALRNKKAIDTRSRRTMFLHLPTSSAFASLPSTSWWCLDDGSGLVTEGKEGREVGRRGSGNRINIAQHNTYSPRLWECLFLNCYQK